MAIYRYKTGTATFTTWLANTAKTCGASIETCIGKDRSIPKTKKPKIYSNHERDIPARQLVKLAHMVAQSTKPRITVPRTIFLLLAEVIALRKKVATMFDQATTHNHDEPGSQGEDGHSHFIWVLEQVREILSPLVEETPVKKDSGNHVQNITNVFEALEVEEIIEGPSTGFLAATIAVVPARTAQKSFTDTYNIEATLGDVFMCSMFFFWDLRKIRVLIQNLWGDYIQGHSNLTTATLVTNTAIDLIQRNVDELFAVMAEWRHLEVPNQDEWIPWVYANICIAMSEDVQYEEEEQVTEKFKFATELVCIETFKRIQALRQFQKSKRLLVLTGKIMPPFVDLLLTELNVLCASGVEILPGIDNITRAFYLGEVSVGGELPMWVVFGMQVLLDIHNTLKHDPHKAFRELQSTGERLVITIRDYFQFTRSMKNRDESWHQKHDSNLLKTIRFISTWIKKDRIADSMKKHLEGNVLLPFNLLKNHPLFCGSIIYWLNTDVQGYGIRFANFYDSIRPAAHLYNAAKQSKHLHTTWPDMEYLISVHTEERIFVGGRPSKPVDYWKRFIIACGGSATNFSRNRRAFRSGDTSKNPGKRALATTSRVQDIFDDRYSQLEKYPDLSDVKLDALMQHIILRHPEMDDDMAASAKNWAKHRKLSSIQLLTALSIAVADDDLHLKFDYISMEIRCAKFYLSIWEKFLLYSEDLWHAFTSQLGQDPDSQALTIEGPDLTITDWLKIHIPESPFKSLLYVFFSLHLFYLLFL